MPTSYYDKAHENLTIHLANPTLHPSHVAPAIIKAVVLLQHQTTDTTAWWMLEQCLTCLYSTLMYYDKATETFALAKEYLEESKN